MGLLVPVQHHRLRELLFQLGDPALALPEAVTEFLHTAPSGGPFQFLEGAVGFAIKTLPGDGALLGQLGDGPVAAEEDGSSAAQAAESGYDTQGVDLCG